MPACAQKARVRFTFVSASTNPMGVVVLAGRVDWVQTCVPVAEVHLRPNGAPSLVPLSHTVIGFITTKPFTGVVTWASAVPHIKNAAVENSITCAIARQHSLKFRMLCLP